MRPTVQLDGTTLTPAEVERISTNHADVSISEAAWQRVNVARDVVEGILERGETVYGINTGFGALVHQRISPDDLATLQTNLIRSHATGLGEPMTRASVRAMMVVRINSLVKGHSGVHPEVLEQLVSFLNHDIVPHVPRIGSLGASGDLAPLSHMALALLGEGEVLSEQGQAISTKEVLTEKGMIGIKLRAKDGLSLINGTSQMLAFMTLAERRLNALMPLADLILCTSMEARKASVKPSDDRVHQARPHPGQRLVAERIRTIMAHSPILASHADCDRVQDAYSFRCAPQVHGAVLQRYHSLVETLEIELNSATDNPLIFPDPQNPGPHEVISQGNFHGEVIALAADSMSAALFELGSISERRIDQMLDPARSELPAFLAQNSGLESGLMIVQYVAGASLAELHGHVMPRAAFSTSTSAGQEDHVSMGATAAWNLLEATKRLSEVLACELFVACEALECEETEPAPFVAALKQRVRTIAKPLTGDRSTSKELISIAEELCDGAWLARIEAELGRIPR
ncbi:MAG TPA: histidine ammonia-lyase [Candidatus Poseidoniaceae archaeon]|nr:MAG TPA: histidine ammonia-lyase [Candidatus Poseidoniales archaeon]HII10965.1 histidine ammonia-lyase [Candidatus Poseidoniaceae archaeon]|tara:strand:- start:436 stop:1986 length:1551 start_codon:yes stop_codon:yes gene_type:complete